MRLGLKTKIYPFFLSVIFLALALFFACSPDLGIAPFYCNNGNPKCPDNYSCQLINGNRLCIKNGESLSDQSLSDSNKEDLSEKDQATLDQGDGKTRELVISEFLADPKATLDAVGEYIELFNPGSTSVDIEGWTLKDSISDSHIITGSITVGPKSFIVLGREKDPTKNGGLTVAYIYSDFYLSNSVSGDEIILLDRNKKLVDKVEYSASSGFTITEGASLSIINPFSSDNSATNWCTETKAWSGSAGDFGTPNMNPGCK